MLQSAADFSRFFLVRNFDLLVALPEEARVEGRGLGGRKMRINRPVFFFLERFDLAFALDDQTKRNGLHTPGGKATTYFVPKQRRNLVSDQAIKNTPRLLRVNQVLINVAWMFESLAHRTLRDFVKRDPADTFGAVVALFLFLGFRAVAELLG